LVEKSSSEMLSSTIKNSRKSLEKVGLRKRAQIEKNDLIANIELFT